MAGGWYRLREGVEEERRMDGVDSDWMGVGEDVD